MKDQSWGTALRVAATAVFAAPAPAAEPEVAPVVRQQFEAMAAHAMVKAALDFI